MPSQSSLSRETILDAFQKMSDQLARNGVTGEICLPGGTVMELVAAYYPPDRIPVKSQYLVEGLFAEGKV